MNSRFEKEVVRGMLPAILIPMIRKGHLRAEHLDDMASAKLEIRRHLRSAVKEAKYHLAVGTEFAKEAYRLWKQGRTWPALTLFATALEQCLNITLRVILEAKGHREDHITAVIKTHNIEAKLTWLWEMHTGLSFPKELVSRARKVFEIRNSIVHFKSVSGGLDDKNDSSSRIDKEISGLRPFHMNTFFYNFEAFCSESTRTCDPAIDLALKITEKFYD